MTQDKRGPGQPTKYSSEYGAMLIEHMHSGLSFESFGGVVGVCKQTLFNWVSSHEEFKVAKAIGTEQSRLYWEKLGRDHVLNESFGKDQGSKSLNATVWIFNMKNRFQWKDKQPEEVENTTINVSGMSDEELKKLALELLKDEK